MEKQSNKQTNKQKASNQSIKQQSLFAPLLGEG